MLVGRGLADTSYRLLPRIARFRLAAGLYETSTALNSGVIRVLERTGAKSALKRMLRRGGSSL